MGNIPVFEWKPDTIPNVSVSKTPNSAPVNVFLYSNYKEYKRLYDYFLTAEDLINSVAGDLSRETFNNIRVMFDNYDGYSINMSADFDTARRDQAICLEEEDVDSGVVAICAKRNSVLNIAAPIEPHKLTSSQFAIALEKNLGGETAIVFKQGGNILNNLESLNSGFTVLSCTPAPKFSDMKCSKFLPKEGANEKWGTRYVPGSKVKMYTYDNSKWDIHESMVL
mgnify:CR=1 FL=1